MRLRRPLPEGQARILKTEKRPAGMAGLFVASEKRFMKKEESRAAVFNNRRSLP